MITEIGGSDNYRNTRVKSFPKMVGQTISEKVGQIGPKYSGMVSKGTDHSDRHGAPMYSRIETGKTEPSLSSLQKIAKALGVKLSELFLDEPTQEVNSINSALIEKVKMIEDFSPDEQKTLFMILDAFTAKKKLKDTLSSVLKNVA